jgi:hypothetical protein
MNTSKLISRLLLPVMLALAITGCASGPQYKVLHATEPPIGSGQGRIYIYRTSALGAAVQPDVDVNGEAVGSAVSHGYFFIDRPPGNYEISTTTEVKRSLSLTLEPAQTRYVRLNIGMGFFVGHVWPELRDNAVAEQEISDCHYIGK